MPIVAEEGEPKKRRAPVSVLIAVPVAVLVLPVILFSLGFGLAPATPDGILQGSAFVGPVRGETDALLEGGECVHVVYTGFRLGPVVFFRQRVVPEGPTSN